MKNDSGEANTNPMKETSAETAIEVVNAAVSAIPFAGGPLAAIVEGASVGGKIAASTNFFWTSLRTSVVSKSN